MKPAVAAVIILATVAAGGWIIWQEMFANPEPAIVYVPPRAIAPAPVTATPATTAAAPVAARAPTSVEIEQFFAALIGGRHDQVQAMLNTNRLLAGARRASDGATPMHVAPTREMAQLLARYGAPANLTDTAHNDTPIRWHARDRTLDLVRYIWSVGGRLPVNDIFYSAAMNDTAQVKRMIADKPEMVKSRSRPNDILGGGATPLIIAAAADRIEMTQLLLDAGADVNDKADADGMTALHEAAAADDDALARLLLDHGAAIDATNNLPLNQTPLQLAALAGNRKVTAILVARGAKVSPEMIEDATRGLEGKLPGATAPPGNYAAVLAILKSPPVATQP